MLGRQASQRFRGRSDGAAQRRRVLVALCTVALVLFLFSLHQGSFFSTHLHKSKTSSGDSSATLFSDWSVSKAVEVQHDPLSTIDDETQKSVTEDLDTMLEEEKEEKDDTDGKEEGKDKDENIVGQKEEKAEEDNSDEGSTLEDTDAASDEEYSQVLLKSIPVCDARYTELIPCLDRKVQSKMKLKLNLSLMEHYERHCPTPDRRLNCLIPPPPKYKVPIRWPASRDEVWQANVPHTFLATEKSDQHWMVVNGQKVNFPGGGTHFPNGADKYIAHLGKMLNNKDGNLSSGGKIRTVLDVGCGVASFGAYLLPLDILAMSLAPNDVHQNQIQFALERGIPATLGVLGTMQLPYPSKSFDLAHCSRCRIDWTQRGGILLLEVDRLLRPGGYFAWSSPPVYRDNLEDVKIWKEMGDLVSRMCWTIAAKRDQTVIWAKPMTNECYEKRAAGTQPPLCSAIADSDLAWQEPMKTCITPVTAIEKLGGATLEPWPKRMFSPPPRLRELGYNSKTFIDDTAIYISQPFDGYVKIAWRKRVDFYMGKLRAAKQVEHDSIRNVMDMKANFGGFAAALKEMDLPVWVMNVVPSSGPSTLKIVYDRGFIGSYHNWCEAYSTYPRTYDLLHAWNVLSDIYNHDCSVIDLLLEMDRLLRPQGIVIIRDKSSLVEQVRKQLNALHWNVWSEMFYGEKDEISDRDEDILITRKQLWQPEDVL